MERRNKKRIKSKTAGSWTEALAIIMVQVDLVDFD